MVIRTSVSWYLIVDYSILWYVIVCCGILEGNIGP